VLDLVAAEAGLADCYRRWGRYGEAMEHGGRALSAAQDLSSPWSVGIAVKLARWRSELNQREEADRLMKVADRAATEHADPVLRMHYLVGHADLLLDAGHFRRARHIAKQALSKGLELGDPVTVLQARTTLAMAYLELGDIAAARDEIYRASRCRREGRSLAVLALQALIAFRSDPDGDARGLFAELEREARQRQEHNEQDFEAWDFEGLATCGTRVGLAAPLDGAVAAFRHAREHTRAPGLDVRLKRWLKILKKKATPGQMDDVLAAVDRTTAGPELS
jgi:tetratricopeptide (TPR) repeat protein